MPAHDIQQRTGAAKELQLMKLLNGVDWRCIEGPFLLSKPFHLISFPSSALNFENEVE